jgi:hypothetical protein
MLSRRVVEKRKGSCGTTARPARRSARGTEVMSLPSTRWSLAGGVDAGEQVDEGALAGAGAAEDAEGLTWPEGHIDVVEGGLVGAGVGEGEVSELERGGSAEGEGGGGDGEIVGGGDDLVDARDGDEAAGDRGEHPGEGHEEGDEAAEEGGEGGDGADRHDRR